MRHVNAIVACRVIPSSVHIDKSILTAGKLQVAIRLVDQSTRSLALEIEGNVGERVALKNVVRDLKCAGTHFAICRAHFKGIVPGLLPGREVHKPEDAVTPGIDRT